MSDEGDTQANGGGKMVQFSQDQVKSLKDAFELVDEDGDGVISEQDLTNIWKDLCGTNPDSKDIEQMLSRARGGVTFPAFLSIMSSSMGAMPDRGDIRDALQIFSKKGDPEMNCDVTELKEYLKVCGYNVDEDFDEMVATFITQTLSGQKIFKGRRFLETVGE